jgi:HEAT repeat protein
VWWSFNRDPYLQLKRAIHAAQTDTGDDDFFLGFGQRDAEPQGTRPDSSVLRSEVVPELLSALAGSDNQDLVTGCLMALAKIGLEPLPSREPGVEATIRGYLSHNNQEISETATVALGILGDEESAPRLAALLQDDAEGRRLVGRPSVPYRTRAFAAYALGLVGNASSRPDVRSFVVFHLSNALENDRTATIDLATACVLSYGLVPLEVGGSWPKPGEDTPRANASREAQLAWLLKWFSTVRGRDSVRVHAPVAMARLCMGAGEAPRYAIAQLLLTVTASFGKEKRDVQRAAVIALGRLGDDDADELDAAIRGKLRKLVTDKDAMSRDFARIALARVATRPGTGDEPGTALAPTRAWFLRDLASGKSTTRPWTALALGVFEFRQQGRGLSPSPAVLGALQTTLKGTKSPRDVGALCTALGLARDASASELLLERSTGGSDDTVKGRASVALGMARVEEAADPLRDLARGSVRKPVLIREVSTALALLGDREILTELIESLAGAKTLGSQSALAASIGRVGDARAVRPLLKLLRDQDVSVTTRAFAAAALGVVGDDEDLTWNSKLAVDLYYGLPPSTLTDGGRGVLDLL